MVLFSGKVNSFILLLKKKKATNPGKDANQSNIFKHGSKQKFEINYFGWLKYEKFCSGGSFICFFICCVLSEKKKKEKHDYFISVEYENQFFFSFMAFHNHILLKFCFFSFSSCELEFYDRNLLKTFLKLSIKSACSGVCILKGELLCISRLEKDWVDETSLTIE